jgi:hypothetical protein
MDALRSRSADVKRDANMPSIISRHASLGARSVAGKIVPLALRHHESASRTDSNTSAPGKASASSGQNAAAGQSTAAA